LINISSTKSFFFFKSPLQYLHNPNYPIHEYRIYNASIYYNSIIQSSIYNFDHHVVNDQHNDQHNVEIEHKFHNHHHHHHWCALYRDNWNCVGDRYENILNKTMPFDSRYTIDKLKPGSRVFIEGNSYYAEVIYSWICETNSFLLSLQHSSKHGIKNSKHGNKNSKHGNNYSKCEKNNNIDSDNCDNYSYNTRISYTINEKDNSKFHDNIEINRSIIMYVRELENDTQPSNHFSNLTGKSNSLFITIPLLNISILLIDNYDYYNYHTNRTISVLKEIGFIPTIISMGRLNREKRFQTKRYSAYYYGFPCSHIHIYHQHLPINCQADFKDCLYNSYGHQCLPGPTLRYAEYLAQELIYLSYL
jgi:hypothetical protein